MSSPLRFRCFSFVLIACFSFVLLSSLAMALYPGGTAKNHDAHGYSFLVNFFSDLGRLKAHNGAPNTFSAPLFALALSLAGAALMVFFGAFGSLFWNGLLERVLGAWGAALGIISGACFMGVAATPSDVSNALHGSFVIWAFRLFFSAVLPFALVIFTQAKTPNRYPKLGGWLFMAFAFLLAAYIMLLSFGPSPRTTTGLVIQVTGQKIIVYASIVCVGLQSVLARRFLREKLSL